MSIEKLIGKTVTEIRHEKNGDERIYFTCSDGSKFVMFHRNDCCEYVRVEDICPDIGTLIGSPILCAEESSQGKRPEGVDTETNGEATQWTFYRISTIKGTVVIRWFGESDYHSTRVDFEEVSE